MDIGIDSINDFASITATADPRMVALLADICNRVKVLEIENKALKHRISDLETMQDELVNKINEHAESINKVWSVTKRPAAPAGQKTIQRLNKLDHILKTHGPRTLGQLEKDLGILPQEMSRLIAKLDKRRYNIFIRPGNKREKVIGLKARIG